MKNLSSSKKGQGRKVKVDVQVLNQLLSLKPTTTLHIKMRAIRNVMAEAANEFPRKAQSEKRNTIIDSNRKMAK